MVSQGENELLTRVEGDAPMGMLMRDHYWLPFALSSHLVSTRRPAAGAAPRGELRRVPRRGRPHRLSRRAVPAPARVVGARARRGQRSALHLPRLEDRRIGLRRRVPEPGRPPRAVRRRRRRSSTSRCTRRAGIAWVWLGGGDPPPFPDLPFTSDKAPHGWLTMSHVPCNWLQGLEGTIDSAHVGVLHQTWHRVTAELPEHANLGLALDSPRATRPSRRPTVCAPPLSARPPTAAPMSV